MLVGGSDRDAWAGPDTTATDLEIGEIRLVLDDIFSPQDIATASGPNRFLRRWMNRLHVNTRQWVVRQELLFATGEPFEPDKLAETERNLRQLGILTGIEVAAVDTTEAGLVTVEVRGRETWTLNANAKFKLASDGTLIWSASLTEKNFLGYNVTLAGALGQDQDATFGRLFFEQGRFLRSPFDLQLSADSRSDGHQYQFRFARPFRQDAQLWSATSRGYNYEREFRYYLSNAGPAGEDPASRESLHALLPVTVTFGEIRGVWRLSAADEGRVWRLGAGLAYEDRQYRLGDGLFELSDGRPADLNYLAEPGSPLARDQGVTVRPYVRLATHGRAWTEGSYLLRYGHQEDIALSPTLLLDAGLAGPATGSTAGYANRATLELLAQDWSRLGRHYALVSAAGEAALGEADDTYGWIDALGGLFFRHSAGRRPATTKVFAEVYAGDRVRGDEVAVLGLDRGLRTLGLDGQAGDRLVRWNLEHGKPLRWQPLGMARIGWALYYGGGAAWFEGEDRDLGDARHEIGLGLRFTGVQSGFGELGRIDVTWSPETRGPVLTTVARGTF